MTAPQYKGTDVEASPAVVVDELTPKAERFCQLYAETGNATLAYLGAFDVSPSTARRTVARKAHDLRHSPAVAARIRALKDALAEQFVINTASLRMRQFEISQAAPLTHVRVYACRYCPSGGKHYAWTDTDEFCDAIDAWTAGGKQGRGPSGAGGFTFDPFAPANPSCRKCMGAGRPVLYHPDTTELTGAEAASYAGAEQDRYGVITVKQHSQQDAAHELHRMVPGAMAATRNVNANVNVNIPVPENMSAEAALAFLETLKPS